MEPQADDHDNARGQKQKQHLTPPPTGSRLCAACVPARIPDRITPCPLLLHVRLITPRPGKLKGALPSRGWLVKVTAGARLRDIPFWPSPSLQKAKVFV